MSETSVRAELKIYAIVGTDFAKLSSRQLNKRSLQEYSNDKKSGD
jgi:hypothetical protein